MTTKRFTLTELTYLQQLGAVECVSESRIQYSQAFRDECMRRYMAGESASMVFRQAGMPPELIGRKRIERCVARWKPEWLQGHDDTSEEELDEIRSHLYPDETWRLTRLETLLGERDQRIKELEAEVERLRKQCV